MVNFRSALLRIGDGLTLLRQLSLQKDFTKLEDRSEFANEVYKLRDYFLTIKYMIDYQLVVKEYPKMKDGIVHRINNEQMENWLSKIHINVGSALLKTTTTEQDQLEFLTLNCMLLEYVVKVLNGDAYFVGCLHKP